LRKSDKSKTLLWEAGIEEKVGLVEDRGIRFVATVFFSTDFGLRINLKMENSF
jgi:hypothetical protein